MKRIILEGLPHHVVIRGNNRRRLFGRNEDYQRFLFYVAQAREETGCRVEAFTVMVNHVHFVIVPKRGDVFSVSRFVGKFSQRYAIHRNKKRNSSGKLFEGPFYCKPITSIEQLACTIAYIELNPVRAGLVEHPEQYRWSSCRIHLGQPAPGIPRRLLQPSAWYRGLGDSPAQRRTLYLDWIRTQSPDDRPDHAEEIAKIEAQAQPDKRRIERPNRKRAG